MTEHRTMNTIIHAAFRRDIARLTGALDAFPENSKPRAEQLWTAWRNFADQLHQHHSDEETIFWPKFRELGAKTDVMSELEGEHATMLAALEAADSAMTEFRADPSAQHVGAARDAVARLGEALGDHLSHEERDLEPWAAEQAGSPQMKTAGRQVRQAHKGGLGTFFAWLQDGADADARAGLRRELPPPVLFMITRLGGRDYRRRIASVWA